MFTAIDMTMCPNLAVPAEVMQHIVRVESSANPFAIGVVGGQLMRQPATLDEALATVQMLDAEGYDYSLGVAQVNRRNLGRYGLDTYQKAFDACANVTAGAQILAECYDRSGSDWGKAFSCYYSGNFVTGYRDGYVQKVYASMRADGGASHRATPIPLKADTVRSDAAAQLTLGPNTPGYRVAIRSVAIDAAANAAVSALANAVTTREQATPNGATSTLLLESAATSDTQPSDSPTDIFRPIVRGPNEHAQATAPDTAPALAATSTAGDHADLRQEQRDAAFVF